MKKRVLAIIITMAMIAVSLLGCNKKTENATDGTAAPDSNAASNESSAPADATVTSNASDEYYMVSFLSGIDYWKTCFNGMKDAAALCGVTAKYTGQSDSDVAGEVAVLEQVIAMKPKGITITCVNSTAFQDTINSAKEQGIAVVCFDSDSPTSERASYLSTGNEDAGKAAANYLVPLCNNTGKIAVLYTVGQENTESRLTGFKAWCAENAPGVELVLVNDAGDTTTAADNLAAALQANPDMAGVFCADGVAGSAGPTAVSESGIQGIHVLAFDVDKTVLDKVKDGSIDATVAQGQYNMGFWSMWMLYMNANGLTQADLPGYVDTGVTIVTKDTVDNYYVKE
jgi:ribose transport system substrate-binding protein